MKRRVVDLGGLLSLHSCVLPRDFLLQAFYRPSVPVCLVSASSYSPLSPPHRQPDPHSAASRSRCTRASPLFALYSPYYRQLLRKPHLFRSLFHPLSPRGDPRLFSPRHPAGRCQSVFPSFHAWTLHAGEGGTTLSAAQPASASGKLRPQRLQHRDSPGMEGEATQQKDTAPQLNSLHSCFRSAFRRIPCKDACRARLSLDNKRQGSVVSHQSTRATRWTFR